MYKKIVTFFLITTLAISNFVPILGASTDIDWDKVDREKITRKAYIHANRHDPDIDPASNTYVYAGEDVNVYAAIDQPNKGRKLPDGSYDISENQYNLNSYVVKFYFDPQFFDLVYCDKNTHENPSLVQGENQTAINYMLPFQTLGLTFEDAEEKQVNGWSESEMQGVIADYTDRTLPTVSTENIFGRDYTVVQGVYVLQGEQTLFPETDLFEANWYNLCNITLRPKTGVKGSTEVMIETGMISNEGVFELIPKHKNGYPWTFKDFTDVLYSGYHQIIIGDSAPVHPPVPDPAPGHYIYPEGGSLNVHLKPATDGSELYYSLDPNAPKFPDDDAYSLYDDTKGIDILYTTTIRCYARKFVNGSYKYSYVMDYNYIIEPPAPTLFFSDGTKVPHYYYTDVNRFYVYGTDKSDEDGMISNIHEIYYTFSPTLGLDEIPVGGTGTDPAAEWVKLDKMTRKIEIDKSTPVRLVTARGISAEEVEFSSVSLYMLYIMPSPVEATPDTNPGYSAPFEVTLTSESTASGAEILFTVDGSDPRTNGIRYTEPIMISKNTTLRAVALLNGAYSATTTFYYLFDELPPLTVSAIPYPGEYTEWCDVYLTTGNFRDVIYYTTDGSAPSENSLVYDPANPIHITGDTVVKAIAVSEDRENKGTAASFRYTIVPEPPIIVPSSAQFNEKSTLVRIYKPYAGEEYTIYYTTDGTNPITSSTRQQTTNDKIDVVVSNSTVINAVIQNSSGHYSEIVTETYEIISGRPVKPEVTLTPGIYIYGNDQTDPYKTSFFSQPEGTKIYYTIGYGEMPENPTPENGVLFSDEDITLYGNVIIKAIAVDENQQQSDLGVFYYTITPESPKIPESCILSDISNVLLPVTGIPGSTVHYEIGAVKNEVTLDGFAQFYIDPITGKAYTDETQAAELGTPMPNDAKNSSPFTLKVYAELDDVKSEEKAGTYTYAETTISVLPPNANIPGGQYPQRAIDENGNGMIDDGEDVVLKPQLYTLTEGSEIYYYYADKPNKVIPYTGALEIKDDCIIYMYAEKDGIKSSENLVFYQFYPLEPVIKPISGIYEEKIDVMIMENPYSPKSANHVIYYKKDSDPSPEDIPYFGGQITVDKNEIIKAYTIKDYNPLDKDSGVRSKCVYEYYIFAGAQEPSEGTIYVNSPFDHRYVFAVNELLENPCNQGITLNTTSGYTIKYKYDVTLQSGEVYSVGENIFTPNQTPPIYPSVNWDTLKITAWLVDDNGNMVPKSLDEFHYNFVKLNKPVSNLAVTDEKGNPILYEKGTTYFLINEYESSDRDIKLFYTTDGSDPTDPEKRKEFKSGDQLTLNTSTTLRAVYMETCDGVSFFGPEAKYIYSLKTTTSGGGGGGISRPPVDNTRKYTKDIFGNEHPTHIGYINGYPDGSVQPDGEITREEIASILYRITNHEYEKPFVATGDVFPDVEAGRWSTHDIEYMADKDIIYGYPDGEFKPERNLTRAEFAALICRFAELEKTDEENPFPDLDKSHWAYENVKSLYASGLLDGYEDGTFRAENEITRAEVMTVVNKLLGRKPDEKYVKSLDFNPYNDLSEKQWHYVTVLEATITHNYWLNDEGYEYKWENWK